MKKILIRYLGIASMTKMMTEYLLLEAIDEGRVKWDQEYAVSEYVYNISQDRSFIECSFTQRWYIYD